MLAKRAVGLVKLMTPDGIGPVAFVTAQRRTSPRSDRQALGGWSRDFFAFAFFCSSNFRM